MLYQLACLLLLVAGVLSQEYGTRRFWSASVVLWAYVGNLAVSYPGGYVHNSVQEIVIMAVLYLIGGRLSLVIMVLCGLCISVNMVSWWSDYYFDSTFFNEVSIGLIFAAQMACIFSRKITDGAYRVVASCRFFRVSHDHSSKAHIFKD